MLKVLLSWLILIIKNHLAKVFVFTLFILINLQMWQKGNKQNSKY